MPNCRRAVGLAVIVLAASCSIKGAKTQSSTSTTPAHNLEPLENKVTRHLRKRQKSPSHGTSCFRNQYVQYAAKSPHGF